MDIYYVGGQFVKEDEAQISVNDLSVIRGYGVFDFLRTYNGVPFHLDDHLKRLQNSARLIGLKLPLPLEEIKVLIEKGLTLSDHKEKNIKIIVTGGLSEDGITPGNAPQLLLMITATLAFPASCYEQGAKLITSHVDRFMPGAKTINYIPAILCKNDAKAQGAVEAIFIDRNGYMQEGTTSNLFVVRDGCLITPPCDRVLPGITRQVVLELAGESMDITLRPIHKDEVRLLDEVFITSSVKEVIPITCIDSTVINNNTIGSLTQKIMTLFAETTANYN